MGPRALGTAGQPSRSKPPSPPASPSLAPGCRLQEKGERQRGISQATEAGRRQRRATGWGPYRSRGAGTGGLATWLESCDTVQATLLGARRVLVPLLGTSPCSGPGDFPAGGGGWPGPRPAHASPSPRRCCGWPAVTSSSAERPRSLWL